MVRERNNNEIDMDLDSNEDEEEEEEISERQINVEEKTDEKLKFTLLDYMWLFNPSAKNEIIILFNDHQKKNELFKSINQFRGPHLPFLFGLERFFEANEVFLSIRIRRKNLIIYIYFYIYILFYIYI